MLAGSGGGYAGDIVVSSQQHLKSELSFYTNYDF